MPTRSESASTVSDSIVHLPTADESTRDAVWEHLERMRDALPEIDIAVSSREAAAIDHEDVPSHAEAFALVIPLLETCLDDARGKLAPALIAQVAFMAMLPGMPETIALQIAFGRGVGVERVRENARLYVRASRRGSTIDEYIRELAAADALPPGKLVRLFHGETRRIPDVKRMARGITLLRAVTSAVPEFMRPPLLCAIAWLQWGRGKRAVASAYLEEAARIEPEHVLAFGLHWLVTTKTPRWC